MPLLLIKGTFRPGTGVPDGDTARFTADNSNLLFRLMQQGSPRLNEQNGPSPFAMRVSTRWSGVLGSRSPLRLRRATWSSLA
jgi:hypothetical protein